MFIGTFIDSSLSKNVYILCLHAPLNLGNNAFVLLNGKQPLIVTTY